MFGNALKGDFGNEVGVAEFPGDRFPIVTGKILVLIPIQTEMIMVQKKLGLSLSGGKDVWVFEVYAIEPG